MKLRQLSAMLIGFALTGTAVLSVSAQEQEQGTDKTQIRILATSDLHGKFFPWDYAANEENRSGSMTQLASAIAEYRTENTLLVDGGDTIQDNESDQFLDSEDAHRGDRHGNAKHYSLGCRESEKLYRDGLEADRL